MPCEPAPGKLATVFALPEAATPFERGLVSREDLAVYLDDRPPVAVDRHSHGYIQALMVLGTAKIEACWLGPRGRWVEQEIDGPCLWLVPADVPHAARLDSPTPVALFYLEQDWLSGITTETLVQASSKGSTTCRPAFISTGRRKHKWEVENG